MRRLERKSAARFLGTAVAQALAEFKGGGQTLAGQFALTQADMGEGAEVETIRFSPGVLAIGVSGAVERVAGALEGFVCVACRQVRFSEREADVDGKPSEAAGVRQKDAGIGFSDRPGVIAKALKQLGCCVEAAELEFDHTGAVGEGPA